MNREENIQKYLDEHLKPGTKIWLITPTGTTMDPKRLAVFRALALKAYELYGKKMPWELFRFGIERVENEHDEFAVSLFLWKAPNWEKLQIGFVPRTKNNEVVNHNRAVAAWLDSGLCRKIQYTKAKGADETFESIRVDLVNIYWDERKKFGGAVFAIHTDEDVRIPRGVINFEGYLKGMATVAIPPDPQGPDLEPPPRDEEVAAPVVRNNVYPPAKIIDKLISAHQEMISYFRLEEAGGVCEPVFMSQWQGEPQRFESENDIETYIKGNDPYTNAATTVDLAEIDKLYGPIMARNYYRLSGIYEGEVTNENCHHVLENIMEVLAVLRRFRR